MSIIDKIKSSKYTSRIIFGITGIIISYIILTYGMKILFPKLHTYQKLDAQKILSIGKTSVPLSIGMCNFDSSTIELNTSNPRKSAYIYLPQSNNLKGGAQFSYSFWLDIKSYNNSDLSNRVIFMRGVNKLMEGYDNSLPFIACPLVKFGDLSAADSGTVSNAYLEVYFNTLKNPRAKVEFNQSVFEFTRSTNQNPRWFLITIVFQDYIDFNRAEKGIQVQSFINNNLVYTDIVKHDSLKVNNGNFYITPTINTIESTNSFYADITYHNYALDAVEIESIYNKGVTKRQGACTTAKHSTFKDINSNYYQKLSMNNYLMHE